MVDRRTIRKRRRRSNARNNRKTNKKLNRKSKKKRTNRKNRVRVKNVKNLQIGGDNIDKLQNSKITNVFGIMFFVYKFLRNLTFCLFA